MLARRSTPLAWTCGLERGSYIPNALPGIVVALSLVFFGARYAGPLYQTLGLLLFAYVVRFLPQALAGFERRPRAVSTRASRKPPAGWAEARYEAFRTSHAAHLPVPGLLAGAALVFLSTMKELPATLLLRPIGFETLATEVWTFHVGRLATRRAAAPGAAPRRLHRRRSSRCS